MLVDVLIQVGDRKFVGEMMQNKFQLEMIIVIYQKIYSRKKKEVGWLIDFFL